MSGWTIAVDQVPTQTVWDWIVRHTDIREAMRDVRPSPAASAPVLDVPHALPIDELREAYRCCCEEMGELTHRVYAVGAPATDRVHLVLGFSPWFDYDAHERVWRSNAWYGKVHPLDLWAGGAAFRPAAS